VTLSERKKRAAIFVLAALLNKSKGITRATNAKVRLAQKGAVVHAICSVRFALSI